MFDFNAETIQMLMTGATGGVPVTGLLWIAIRALKKSFDRLNDRIEGLGKEVATLNGQISALDKRLGTLDEKIESLGKEMKVYTDRLIRVETVIKEKISDDVKELKDRVRSLETLQVEWRQ
jgi:chromosome segregation ATPase